MVNCSVKIHGDGSLFLYTEQIRLYRKFVEWQDRVNCGNLAHYASPSLSKFRFYPPSEAGYIL